MEGREDASAAVTSVSERKESAEARGGSARLDIFLIVLSESG